MKPPASDGTSADLPSELDAHSGYPVGAQGCVATDVIASFIAVPCIDCIDGRRLNLSPPRVTIRFVPRMTDLKTLIREVPDFPKPGILFYDITTLLKDAAAYREAIDLMLAPYNGEPIDVVVGMESRGFIFSAPMAYQLNAGLVPVRKLGKLPAETITVEYALEYGSNTLEIHRDAIQPGQKVLVVDDLLATGGTVHGTIELVERLKGDVIGLAFLVELEFLKGRDRLEGRRVTSVIQY
jgi:adenine phosphoribosyltransferase